VELHGGAVHVVSPGDGKGSVFSVRLPLTDRQASIGPWTLDSRPEVDMTQVLDEQTNVSGLSVLVVDDEADGREMIRHLLEEHGATVSLASSAEEALSALGRHCPDVIISDIGMPGCDGYTFMSAVRKRGMRVPAAALTAFARSEDRTRALNAGYQTHISKPADAAELLATVAALAHMSSDRDRRAN
jgi:CheY-like chemotaxis protein